MLGGYTSQLLAVNSLGTLVGTYSDSSLEAFRF